MRLINSSTSAFVSSLEVGTVAEEDGRTRTSVSDEKKEGEDIWQGLGGVEWWDET